MKKTLIFTALCFGCIGVAAGAVRDTSTVTRTAVATPLAATRNGTANRLQTSVTSRTGGATVAPRTTQSARTATRTVATTASRPTTTRASGTVARGDTAHTATARTAATPVTRAAKSGVPQSARAARAAIGAITSRAATSADAADSQSFGTGYNECRDAYFTCMDQFCANANDTYRRCICSKKLTDIQSREKLLGQTASDLQDFKDLNLDVIKKSPAEVKAMLNATAGESVAATAKDTSDSAKQLAGISDVLSSTRNKSLSTQGTLDIAGDINAIWATSSLTSGASIANLTGEALYSAVHSQCVEMVADVCPTSSVLNMVISAYGMYIENDCNALIGALDKQTATASGNIRATEREMNQARLENYNTHNATAINDCIAQVRQDVTSDTACGKDYVHCLDVTGKYLNYTTGEPIYSADFYQLATQISLSGDILTNPTNQLIVAELTRKREYAARGLDTCRDIADDVWREFMRQAITEIYQGQQERIRQVKTECLDVVNKCYDEQSAQLKDFTANTDDQLLLGSRLELSEQMCETKMNTCSNLYGNGSNGMKELLATMHEITDQKIAKQCLATLQNYAKDICTPPASDNVHTYPYACRAYTPGTSEYAYKPACNTTLAPAMTIIKKFQPRYTCTPIFTGCPVGYYLYHRSGCLTDTNCYQGTPMTGNQCRQCPVGCTCGDEDYHATKPECHGDNNCGDYPNSLYQRLVRYALQACMRSSDAAKNVPSYEVVQDVNNVMDSIRVDMSKSLAAECERLGGIWESIPWETDRNDPTIHRITRQKQHQLFYNSTNASKEWGFCASGKSDTGTETVVTIKINCGYDPAMPTAILKKQCASLQTTYQSKIGDPVPTLPNFCGANYDVTTNTMTYKFSTYYCTEDGTKYIYYDQEAPTEDYGKKLSKNSPCIKCDNNACTLELTSQANADCKAKK